MGSEWVKKSLGDLIELKRGYDLPKKDRIAGDVPLVSSAGISDFHSEAKVSGPGVITGRYGTIGVVFYCEDDFWPLNTTLYVKDFKGNDEKFVYYFLKTIDYNKYSDKAAVPGVNRNHLHLAEVFVPTCIEEQKQIASILGALDNKIQLNRQINTTLESMAQALFKSWFVDFDPVIDNALAAGNPIPDELLARAEKRAGLRVCTSDKGARRASTIDGASENLRENPANPHPTLPADIQQLFPSSFVFTEALGWVPEGWEVGVLEDLLVLQRGFDLPKSARTDGPFPLVAASGQDGTHNDFKVSGPGITTGRSGKLGEVCFVEKDFWPLNTTLWVKAFKRSSPYHAFYLLKSMDLEKYNSGSAVPTLNRNYVHNVAAILPEKEVVSAYDQFVSACYTQKYSNDEQSRTLAELRDELLPRLLSGRLQIPEAKQKLAEVI